jgi:hypothetical protein
LPTASYEILQEGRNLVVRDFDQKLKKILSGLAQGLMTRYRWRGGFSPANFQVMIGTPGTGRPRRDADAFLISRG